MNSWNNEGMNKNIFKRLIITETKVGLIFIIKIKHSKFRKIFKNNNIKLWS